MLSSSAIRHAGVAPLTVPCVPGPVGGLPNAWTNYVLPVTYPLLCGPVGAYPYCIY